MYDYNMLTPGPSKVRKNVLEARAIQAGNSDLDPEFYDFYKRTCAKYSHFLNTANPSFRQSGFCRLLMSILFHTRHKCASIQMSRR